MTHARYISDMTQASIACSKCLGRQRFAVADHEGATYVVRDGNGVGHWWREVWCRSCGHDVPVGEPTTSACPGCTEECSACEGTGSVRCDSCGVTAAVEVVAIPRSDVVASVCRGCADSIREDAA